MIQRPTVLVLRAGASVPLGYPPANQLRGEVLAVHETLNDAEEYGRARKLQAAAELIVFIGFGYGATNLQRLAGGLSMKPAVKIFGSCRGFTDLEVQEKLSQFGSLLSMGPTFTADPMKREALEFLREQVSFH